MAILYTKNGINNKYPMMPITWKGYFNLCACQKVTTIHTSTEFCLYQPIRENVIEYIKRKNFFSILYQPFDVHIYQYFHYIKFDNIFNVYYLCIWYTCYGFNGILLSLYHLLFPEIESATKDYIDWKDNIASLIIPCMWVFQFI